MEQETTDKILLDFKNQYLLNQTFLEFQQFIKDEKNFQNDEIKDEDSQRRR